jgi:DNA processing protein
MTSPEDIYKIALTKLPLVGSVLAKNLVSYCGGVKEVFHTSKAKLLKVPLIGPKTAEAIEKAAVLEEAETELKELEGKGIQLLFYLDKDYPHRLRFCPDGPILLYFKGTADLNNNRIISIVGTRNNTRYGEEVTEQIVSKLAPYQVTVVSGMAYGIDIIAHRAALRNGMPTVGVFAHGLDQVYPWVHQATAEKMVDAGGLLTEFPFNTRPDRENFPMRNRIVAGLADAVIVVETAVKGGAMITANIANSYSREVFAVPGLVEARFSKGCNNLIRTNRAILFEDVDSFVHEMNWQQEPNGSEPANRQYELFVELEGTEKAVVEMLQTKHEMLIDELVMNTGLNPTIVSSTLLELEFKGLVKSLPGKKYRLVRRSG